MSNSAADGTPAQQPRRRLLRNLSVAAGIFVLLGLFGSLAQRWTTEPKTDAGSETIANQWNMTIARLGLEPIYPPQEDIAVGDIFLIISGDSQSSDTLLGRSIKLWHIDLSKELKEAYKDTYTFPETLPKPKDGEFWPQQAAKVSIFETGAERQQLPLVLLPGFTIARFRQAEIAGGWLSKTLKAFGAMQAEGESTVELKIPFAETYGLPAIIANGYLVNFCNDLRFRNVCTEEGARGFLSTIVGASAFEKVQAKPGDTEQYRLDAEILIISRVYLTRSIETVTYSGSGLGAQTKLAVQLNEALQRLDAEMASATKPPNQAQPESAQKSSLQRALEEHKARLQAVVAQAANSPPGGTVSIQSLDSSRISATQQLQRPVAIAFRAIRTSLSK